MSGYIVNRVLPADLMSQDNVPEYLKNRYEMQQRYVQRIDSLFGDEVLAQVPEFERDIAGIDMIERIADVMFGENGE